MGRFIQANFFGALFFLIFGGLIGAVLVGQRDQLPVSLGLSGASAEKSFDTGRLARIDDYMNQAVADDVMVGGMAKILHRGKVVYDQKWGYRDREAKVRMRDDTIFRIYSMSKPITSAAVMILVEEGAIRLDAPIGDYIPSLAALKVHDPRRCKAGKQASEQFCPRVPERQPTIRDLLTHSAGFSYGISSTFPNPVDSSYRKADWFNRPDLTLEQFVGELSRIPLLLEPGEQWFYSIATDVLGRVVEVASGMEFAAFLRTRIFAPLAMHDTSFTIDPDKIGRLAQLYTPKAIEFSKLIENGFTNVTGGPGLDVAVVPLSAGYVMGSKFKSGGGGLLSTTDDYLRFAQMIHNGGVLEGVRILSPQSVLLMSHDNLGDTKTAELGAGLGFGLGFGVITDAAQATSFLPTATYSWGGAAGTVFWIDPTNDIIAIFMTQSLPHISPLREQIQVLIYQALVD